MYNMTGIAKFYNKFLSFIELYPTRPTYICKFSDPARPDPTRPAGRHDPRATLGESLWMLIWEEGGHPPTTLGVKKLESLGYHVVLFAWAYV